MKQLKLLFLLFLSFLGAIYSQDNSTQVAVGTAPPVIPFDSKIPPKQPKNTDKVIAITDERFAPLKPILAYLPPVEQDLIAGKIFFTKVILKYL